jgi:hypothetical protein
MGRLSGGLIRTYYTRGLIAVAQRESRMEIVTEQFRSPVS